MSEKIKESFPGQPEDKDIVTGVSVPFKQANKEHDENVKNAEEAMEANKEAVDLVYGDNTKKKDGNFKNNELKKMHLSEDLFSDNFNEDVATVFANDGLEDGTYELRMAISDFLDEYGPTIREDKLDQETVLSAIEDEVKGFYRYWQPELNESCDNIDEEVDIEDMPEELEEDIDLDEAVDTVFDKIAKKLAVSEDLKKNE